jgi:hypothetical protein
MTKSLAIDETEEEVNNLYISSIEKIIWMFQKEEILVLDLNGLLADIVFPPPSHMLKQMQL